MPELRRAVRLSETTRGGGIRSSWGRTWIHLQRDAALDHIAPAEDRDYHGREMVRRFTIAATVVCMLAACIRLGFAQNKSGPPRQFELKAESPKFWTLVARDAKLENHFQGVYRLGNDGNVRLLTKELDQPNGLAFSPDGKRLYIDDTKQKEIRVYDVAANGDLANGRLFGKEEGRGGVPDGMRVDVSGNLFVTGPG